MKFNIPPPCYFLERCYKDNIPVHFNIRILSILQSQTWIFIPCIRYTAVQLMGSGMTPSNAALFSIKPIIKFYPDFNGAVIAVNSKGEHGS